MALQVETAGDCYIVSAGIMSPKQPEGFGLVVEEGQDPSESAKRVLEFSKAILEAARMVNSTQADSRAFLGMFISIISAFHPWYLAKPSSALKASKQVKLEAGQKV